MTTKMKLEKAKTGGRITSVMAISCSREMLEQVKEVVSRKDLSVSQYVRRLIERDLKRYQS